MSTGAIVLGSVGPHRRGSKFDDGPTLFESTDDHVIYVAALLGLVKMMLTCRWPS